MAGLFYLCGEFYQKLQGYNGTLCSGRLRLQTMFDTIRSDERRGNKEVLTGNETVYCDPIYR